MIDKSAYFLVGPTASGKSQTVHLLAKKLSTSIISADSMNIYSKMDIGTAKPSLSMQKEVNYVGLNIVDPTETYNVVEWLDHVNAIWNQFTNTPIVSGGTGLYLKCLIDGIESNSGENESSRIEFEKLTLEQLQSLAKKNLIREYEFLTSDDKKNRRRLIRLFERGAIENSWKKKASPTIMGLYLNRKALHRNIEQRVVEMFDNGILEEAEKLFKFKLSKTAKQAIGYQEIFEMFKGIHSKDEAIEKTIIRTRKLAKKQMTWFKNKMNINWIDISDYKNTSEVVNRIYDIWVNEKATKICL